MSNPKRKNDNYLFDRRKVLLGLSLVAVSGVAQARLPTAKVPRIETETLTDMVPDRIGNFNFETESGLVLPPEDALSDRLYDNLVTRTYSRADGAVVMLLIAYNNEQDGVLQIHRPEICYPAGGFELTETRPIDVDLGTRKPLPARLFSALGENRNEVVLYWTRVGNSFPRRWIEQRWAVAEANLQGDIPDGVLVRVSALSRDERSTAPVLQRFISDFHRQSPKPLQELLFGGNRTV